MSHSIQRTLLILCAGVAFVMPWTFNIEGLFANFAMGFISGCVGGMALRAAVDMGKEEDNEK